MAAPMDGRLLRSCLHCALARAIRDEGEGLVIDLRRSEPVLLPVPGQRIYRAVRRLLRAARAQGQGRDVKLTVADLPGTSHVEVLAVVSAARGARVLRCLLPRHADGTLSGGFAEALLVD
jgi:hypothetical protein